MRWLAALGAVLGFAASGPAEATVIFQTRPDPGPASGGGTVVGASQFLGFRFLIEDTTTIESVGGNLGALPGGNGLVFAAVVQLSAFTDFPDSLDLGTADVLGSATILPPTGSLGSSGTVGANLTLTLQTGWYALVFGSGRFGATGQAFLHLEPDDAQEVSFFLRGSATGGSWESQSGGGRYYAFVSTSPIPEPATGALLAAGLSLLAGASRRSALRNRRAGALPSRPRPAILPASRAGEVAEWLKAQVC